MLRSPSDWDSEIPNWVKLRYLFDSNPRKNSPHIYKFFKYATIFVPGPILRYFFQFGDFDISICFHEPMIFLLNAASGKKVAWIHGDYSRIKFPPEIGELRRKDGKLARAITYRRSSLHEQCSKIVCVSEGALNGFQDRYPETFGKLTCLYNPQDEQKIVNYAKTRVALKDCQGPRFCTIGRFSDEKAYYRVVDAAARLKQEGYEFSIVMVGDGPTHQKIFEQVKKCELDEVIHLVGNQRNPYKYLSKCDCLLSSSKFEAFSTVACEAMILGIPVVTTDCAGMAEILGEDSAGIITPNSVDGLYFAMRSLLNKPESLLTIKTKAIGRRDFFNRKRSVGAITSMIDSLL